VLLGCPFLQKSTLQGTVPPALKKTRPTGMEARSWLAIQAGPEVAVEAYITLDIVKLQNGENYEASELLLHCSHMT
jgi:hypothetical protein